MFSPTLATVGVDNKVSERCKYGMSHPSGFESKKKKDHNFQPTKKQHLLLKERTSSAIVGRLFCKGMF